MAEESGSDKAADAAGGVVTKAVAGVFATIIAPVAVAFGIKYSDVLVAKLTGGNDPAKAEARSDPPKGDASKEGESKDAKKEPGGDKPAASKTAGVKPEDFKYHPTAAPFRLFRGTARTGFYTWLGSTASDSKPPGKDKDPDKVFIVKNGTVHVSGQDMGALVSTTEYGDYHLSLEYKWGADTWGERKGKARQAGILLHCVGPDDAVRGYSPQCIKCQIIEGGTGDLVCYAGSNDPGKLSLTSEAVRKKVANELKGRANYQYVPGSEPVTMNRGIVRRLGNGNDWKDETGFHRKNDVEIEGDWNHLECICLGDRIKIVLNDKPVNIATGLSPSRGRIGIQSHGAAIMIRKFEIQPIASD